MLCQTSGGWSALGCTGRSRVQQPPNEKRDKHQITTGDQQCATGRLAEKPENEDDQNETRLANCCEGDDRTIDA